ncbi:MAG TPA: type II secretion system F family protein [Alphaproteobacteria bacterium]|nr:type II secretion system F family protein [Alphaproteobacteria bacterium]
MSTAAAFQGILNYLPFGLKLPDLVAILAAAATFAAVLATLLSLRVGHPFERRLKSIRQRQADLRSQMLEPRRRAKARRRSTSAMHQLVQRLNLLRSKHATEAQLLLARAGFRSQDAMVRYLFFRLILPTIFGLAVAIDAYWVPIVAIPDAFRAVASFGGVLLGFYAPPLYLKNTTDKRYKEITRAMPDGLDLMVICAGAGLSLDGSLQRVARELGKTWPALAEEFTLTAVELTFLPDRKQALTNLIQRVELATMRSVVSTLQQTEKFGTPLVQSLRVLAAEFRDQRMMKAEEKAARLSVLLTLPMIGFIMPALFIVLLGPAALNVMDMMHNH